MGIKEKYSRMSKIYDWVESRMPMGDFKKEAVTLLSGKILEVGIGSGANIKLYNKDMDITGIDFSPGMLELAREKAEKFGLTNLKLIEMDIEKMDFPDNSFDSVLSTCVFCTVPHPAKGIAEIQRVLKPGGKAIFLEHMKSDSSVINIFLTMMNILTTTILGTSLLRETQKTIRAAGFSKVQSKNLMMKDVLRLIVVEK